MKILGHRGASADFPENTLEAFRGAIAQGADGVELDVMRCSTGELVVCHDEWLDRLAGLHWEVRATSWAKLSRVDVGTHRGFACARIPLLDQVFDALPSEATVNVELKCETVDDFGLSVAVGQKITERQLSERVLISSFNPLCLLRLARAFPALPRGFLLDPDRAWLPQAWLWLPVTARTSVHPHFSQVTPARVRRWHAQGWQVASWTVDDPGEAARLQSLGVEWIITNRPAALRKQLSQSV